MCVCVFLFFSARRVWPPVEVDSEHRRRSCVFASLRRCQTVGWLEFRRSCPVSTSKKSISFLKYITSVSSCSFLQHISFVCCFVVAACSKLPVSTICVVLRNSAFTLKNQKQNKTKIPSYLKFLPHRVRSGQKCLPH